jgi:hypothetical protein
VIWKNVYNWLLEGWLEIGGFGKEESVLVVILLLVTTNLECIFYYRVAL